MSWEMYRWVWELRSPLHIGTTPAGSLNRTRLYIPARNMWAALTAEIARRQANAAFPDYAGISQTLGDMARFTYLYPAEQINRDWYAWLPRYQNEGNAAGLFWCREDGAEMQLSHRRFRQRLLHTQPGTAIDPETDAAAEGTLREFEYISPQWRSENGADMGKPVYFVGYVFIAQRMPEEYRRTLCNARELFVGGETRYGFGHLVRVFPFGQLDHTESGQCFGRRIHDGAEGPVVEMPQHLLAHAKVARTQVDGEREILVRWDGPSLLQPENSPLYCPGSRQRDANADFYIDRDGLWVAL